jgi:hypothetical protein
MHSSGKTYEMIFNATSRSVLAACKPSGRLMVSTLACGLVGLSLCLFLRESPLPTEHSMPIAMVLENATPHSDARIGPQVSDLSFVSQSDAMSEVNLGLRSSWASPLEKAMRAPEVHVPTAIAAIHPHSVSPFASMMQYSFTGLSHS